MTQESLDINASLDAIQRSYKHLDDAKAAAKAANTEAKDRLERASAKLKDAIETGVAPGDDEGARVKLSVVELAYQELEEQKAVAKDIRAAARDNLKAARKILADAIADSKQLTLPGT